MKVFISQPMNGKTDEEIKQLREHILENIRIGTKVGDSGPYKCLVKVDDKEVIQKRKIQKREIIQNIDHKDAPRKAGRLWYLGASISKLDDADVAVFAPGWKKAKGCRVEFTACELYGIPVFFYT